jgi:hypothetical protein
VTLIPTLLTLQPFYNHLLTFQPKEKTNCWAFKIYFVDYILSLQTQSQTSLQICIPFSLAVVKIVDLGNSTTPSEDSFGNLIKTKRRQMIHYRFELLAAAKRIPFSLAVMALACRFQIWHSFIFSTTMLS